MGIAAMIIGIVALLIGFIPLFGMVALLPAIVGLVLGIVDVAIKTKKKLPRGIGVAGIVLNAVTIGVIILWTSVIAGSVAVAAAAAATDDAKLSQTKTATGIIQTKTATGIILNRAYAHAVNQRGRTARAEFLEFWNNTAKPVSSFAGKVTLYDRSNPDRVDATSEIECQTPLEPNAKIWLVRTYVDGALNQSVEADDQQALVAYARNMEVPVMSLIVPKFSFKPAHVTAAK